MASAMSSASAQLFSDFWAWRLDESPEFASMSGSHPTFDGRLDSWDLDAFERRSAAAAAFLRRAEDLLSNRGMGEREVFDLKVLSYDLSTFIEGLTLKGYSFPICFMEGPQAEFEQLFGEWIDKSSADGAANLLKRLEGFPRQIEEKIGCMRWGLKAGRALHAVSLKGVVEAIDKLVQDSSPILAAALRGFEGLTTEAAASLKFEAERIVDELLRPAFRRLREFFVDEYLPKTRTRLACRSLPNGDAYYAACLRFHAGRNVTPEETHGVGVAEVERIEREMNRVKKEMRFEGSMSELNSFLRNDPRFYFKNKDEMMSEFRSLIFHRIRPRLKKVFGDSSSDSEFPLHVEPTPDSMSLAPVGFYLSGSPDGRRPCKFLLNLRCFDQEPKFQATALALHEAEPGHHSQAAAALSRRDAPEFRRMLEDRLYSIAPSRFPTHGAFVEGWALYAESLGVEMGLFDDPLDLMGKLQMEMLRAARLVVDTGLHWLGWSRDDAMDYLLEKTAMTAEAVAGEADRYVTWPGQACAYKMGEMALKRARERCEEKSGKDFNLKEFHDRVLSWGYVPLSLLEEMA